MVDKSLLECGQLFDIRLLRAHRDQAMSLLTPMKNDVDKVLYYRLTDFFFRFSTVFCCSSNLRFTASSCFFNTSFCSLHELNLPSASDKSALSFSISSLRSIAFIFHSSRPLSALAMRLWAGVLSVAISLHLQYFLKTH